jgi:hypothetical protein
MESSYIKSTILSFYKQYKSPKINLKWLEHLIECTFAVFTDIY